MLSKPGLILQHGDDGPPARFGEWLRERDLPFVVHHLGELPPADPHSHAFVASLGSERSAAERTDWIPGEIDYLRAAVAADVPVLGLCFGGQALSLALGGGIAVLPAPEIGWISLESDDASIPPGPWLQYHFDLMHVPPGARELARSPAGPAAFRHGRHLALQFHPEVDTALVDRWARSDPKLPATGITAEQLAEQGAVHAEAAREHAFRLFDGWRRLALAG
jgi:GMP synthase-like glutamine amidotransferase